MNVTVLDVSRGAKSQGNSMKSGPSCSIGMSGFRRVTRHSRIFASEVPNIYNYIGFRMLSWQSGNGQLRMLYFAVLFLVFWGTLSAFRSQKGPEPENLPFRVGF